MTRKPEPWSLNQRPLDQLLLNKAPRATKSGQQGRLSTDLDFTRRSDRELDDIILDLLTLIEKEYRGISFQFEREKDWYVIEEGGSGNPLCHATLYSYASLKQFDKLGVSVLQPPAKA